MKGDWITGTYFIQKIRRGGGIYFLNETSACGLNTSLVEWSLDLLAIDAIYTHLVILFKFLQRVTYSISLILLTLLFHWKLL
jgi:hypothetical protein